MATEWRCCSLDLDNFKQINDSLGHAAGDQMLHMMAARLASLVRQTDTVSRYGDDEFVILLTEVSRTSDAVQIADKLIAALGTPSRVGDQVMHLMASIGVSIYPDDGEDVKTLIEHAVAAMYRAKTQGLGKVAAHGTEPTGERDPEQPTFEPLHLGSRPRERAMNEHQRSQVQLREGNAQLVLTALSAQEMRSTAEQAHQRLTQLMAVVAHELRNPITPIRTAAAMLGRVRSDEVPQLQAIIERQVVRLSGMVDDLLDVSRINAGKLRLEREVVGIAGVIAEAVDACRPAIATRLQHERAWLAAERRWTPRPGVQPGPRAAPSSRAFGGEVLRSSDLPRGFSRHGARETGHSRPSNSSTRRTTTTKPNMPLGA